MKKPEEMSDVELVGYFEGETIAYGTAAAGSKEESDADAHGEAAKAELLRRLGAAVSASADDHELGDPLWPIYQKLAETADKPHLTYSGWLRTIAQKLEREFFAAAPAQEPDERINNQTLDTGVVDRLDDALKTAKAAQEQPVEPSPQKGKP